MNSTIQKLEDRELRKDLPVFRVGDTLRLQVKVVEGEKERIQSFEGIVIKMNRGGNRATFTVRKDLLRNRRRAHFPAALAAAREDSGAEPWARAPGAALLPARALGQGRSGRLGLSLAPTRGADISADLRF